MPALLAAMFGGDREAAERARWQTLVVDVVRRIDDYKPAHFPFPALLDGVTLEQIRAATANPNGDRTLVAAFAKWRQDVRHLEVTNGKRLRALGGALEYIATLRRRGVEHDKLDRYERYIRQHLRTVWNLEPPTEEPARTWAERHASRPDLLPHAWRGPPHSWRACGS